MVRYLPLTRSSRKIQLRSRTLVSGSATRVELVTTICTKNTEIPLWMVLLNKCMMRWLLVTGCAIPASRLLRQPPFLKSFANVRIPSNFRIPKSSFLWSTVRLDPHQESWKQPSRHPDLIYLCKAVTLVDMQTCFSRRFCVFTLVRVLQVNSFEFCLLMYFINFRVTHSKYIS